MLELRPLLFSWPPVSKVGDVLWPCSWNPMLTQKTYKRGCYLGEPLVSLRLAQGTGTPLTIQIVNRAVRTQTCRNPPDNANCQSGSTHPNLASSKGPSIRLRGGWQGEEGGQRDLCQHLEEEEEVREQPRWQEEEGGQLDLAAVDVSSCPLSSSYQPGCSRTSSSSFKCWHGSRCPPSSPCHPPLALEYQHL